jgi:hypothetical protein
MTMNKPYVLIVVQGGIADLGLMVGEVDYDILDIDSIRQNLNFINPSEEITISKGERTWIAAHESTLLDQIDQHNVAV